MMKAQPPHDGAVVLVVMLVTLISLVIPISAHSFYGASEDGVSSDLASKLQTPPVRQQELFSHALRIIHSMESSPSCNRLAALTLINSCQSLEMSAKDPKDTQIKAEPVLDEVKSEYAARLAVCELIGAKANVPRECSMFVPSARACGKFRLQSLFNRQENDSDGKLCYPDASHSQFGQCLRALESRPQWWTSYSNARQNAVVMCQASRDAIERDEKLSLYKSLADVTLDIMFALAKSVEEAQARLAEQMAFAEQIRASQAQVLTDLEQGRKDAMSSVTGIMFDMRSAVQAVINMMSQAWMKAESDVEELNQSLHESKAALHDTREGIFSLLNDVAFVQREHAVSQNHHWELSRENALAIQKALDSVRTSQLQALLEAFGGLRNELQISADLMDQMYERQNLLDQRLANLDGTFEALETTATNLRTTVDKTTDMIQQMTIFGGFGSVLGAWGGVILVFLGVWFASRRVAGWLAAIAGVIWMLRSVSAFEWLNTASTHFKHRASSRAALLFHYASNHPKTTKYVIIGFIVVASIYGIALVIDTSGFDTWEDDQGEQGLLLKIEAPELPALEHRRRHRHYNPFTFLVRSNWDFDSA